MRRPSPQTCCLHLFDTCNLGLIRLNQLLDTFSSCHSICMSVDLFLDLSWFLAVICMPDLLTLMI